MVPPEHVWGVIGYVELCPWGASLGITAGNAYFQNRLLVRGERPSEASLLQASQLVRLGRGEWHTARRATLASISAYPSHDWVVVGVKVLSEYDDALTWHTLRLEGASRFAALSWIERIGTFRIPNH